MLCDYGWLYAKELLMPPIERLATEIKHMKNSFPVPQIDVNDSFARKIQESSWQAIPLLRVLSQKEEALSLQKSQNDVFRKTNEDPSFLSTSPFSLISRHVQKRPHFQFSSLTFKKYLYF